MQSRRLRQLVLLAAPILAVVQAALAWMLITRGRDTALDAARSTVERVAHVAEGTLNRTLLQVDGTLAGLPAMLAPLAQEGRLDPLAANRLLRELQAQSFTYRDLLLVRADGSAWGSALAASRRLTLPVDLRQMDASGRAGTLMVAGPARNPTTGEWALFLARPVRLPGAPPLFAVAEVPVPLVTTLLAPVGDQSGLRIMLQRPDGQLLASVPHDETRIGRPMEGALPANRANGQAFAWEGPMSRRAAMAAARSTLYAGITVIASYEEAAALASWTRDRDRIVGVSLGASVLLLCLGLALAAALRSREEAEAERARARATLESAIESMSDGFVMFDAEDRLVVCNTRYRDLYEASAPFIQPGAKFEDIIRQGALRGQYPQAGTDIEGFVAETVAWHRSDLPPRERLLPDGRWIMVTERSTPDGGTVGIRTDISALKQAMTELADARDAAAAQTEAKSRFLARMSHELRTPLNGVLGHAQALARDPSLTPQQRSRAATLESAGRHLLAVANDVLDLARVEAGRIELRPQPVPLPPLLTGCVDIMRPAADEKRVALTVQLAPELPAGIFADRTRLSQLVLNLISNAVKFTPTGGRVELRARPCEAVPGLLGLRIEVLDTGPGVPANARQAVFGDFVRLDGNAVGAGLGLAISAGIAEAMGGRIGCEDNPEPPLGRGALFWVELMLPPAMVENQDAVPDLADSGSLQVLVVDDVPANLAVARALLETAGHKVDCAGDGALALRLVEDAANAGRPYDVVLMDVMMPDMDGLETTRRLRALPGDAGRLPILALTASAFDDDIKACLAAGMDGHMSKPIEQETLAAAFANIVSRPRRHEWGRQAA